MMERTLCCSRDADDIIPRFFRAGRPKNFCAARFELGDKFLQVTVEMVDGFPFDFGGAVCARPASFGSGFETRRV